MAEIQAVSEVPRIQTKTKTGDVPPVQTASETQAGCLFRLSEAFGLENEAVAASAESGAKAGQAPAGCNQSEELGFVS